MRQRASHASLYIASCSALLALAYAAGLHGQSLRENMLDLCSVLMRRSLLYRNLTVSHLLDGADTG